MCLDYKFNAHALAYSFHHLKSLQLFISFFQNNRGTNMALLALFSIPWAQASPYVKFSIAANEGECGAGFDDAVVLTDTNCHSVESFGGKGFGGPADIGVRSIDVHGAAWGLKLCRNFWLNCRRTKEGFCSQVLTELMVYEHLLRG
jgi:hypothetical protein